MGSKKSKVMKVIRKGRAINVCSQTEKPLWIRVHPMVKQGANHAKTFGVPCSMMIKIKFARCTVKV